MTTKKMLLETLNDLSSEELEEFKSLIKSEKDFQPITMRQLKVANTQDIVELMVETYSQDCVELTKKVLQMMNRTDLVQRLLDISSGTKGKTKKTQICENILYISYYVTERAHLSESGGKLKQLLIT